MIEIDGSLGEGGGQVLRSSLTLSLLTGAPVHLRNIRAGRSKPGLLRQHLTAVNAAAAVGRAEVEGAALGAGEIRFVPHGIHAGTYTWSIGTAGSTTLVLQTVLLPLLAASDPSTVTIEGGTHNPGAPPFHFLDAVWAPHLRSAAARVDLRLEKWGLFPTGGGRLSATVRPGALPPVAGERRGPVTAVVGHVAAPGVPPAVADRAVAALRKGLGTNRDGVQLHDVRGTGPGVVVWIEVEFDGGTERFTAFQERREGVEDIVARALVEFRTWRDAGAPVGEHLADQLLLPLALAGGAFRMGAQSEHFRTNVAVIERFLPVRFVVREGRVSVEGAPRAATLSPPPPARTEPPTPPGHAPGNAGLPRGESRPHAPGSAPARRAGAPSEPPRRGRA